VGTVRRMVSQFSSELDSQLKADELRKELRKAGDVGLEDVQKSVRGALDEARKYEHMVLPDSETPKYRSAPATQNTGKNTGKKPPENLEPDEHPSAANNSGHSSLDVPDDDAPRTDGDKAPDKPS
jgi:sec-independent protein translocase protein TatB